jgi:hypothetical protein
MDDVNGIGENPITVRHNIPIVAGTSRYQLPGNFGTFLRWGRWDATQGEFDEAGTPRSRWNPYGGGLLFEGNTLVMEPIPQTASTDLYVEYVPSGHCGLHTGSTDTSDTATSTTTLVLDTDPAEGYYDRLPNAYVGCVLRLLSSDEVDSPSDYTTFPIQERIISAVDAETAVATLNGALDFDPTASPLGACTYEVVPFLGYEFQGALAWRIALMIAETRGDKKRISSLQAEYLRQVRGIRLRRASMNARTGNRFEGDVSNGTGEYY